MLKNILKIPLCLCLMIVIHADHETQLATQLLDEFPRDLNISPFVRVGKKLYHFGYSKVSWFKASLICRALGGFLASINDKEEMSQLSDYLNANYPPGNLWWISGSDIDQEGVFYWYRTGERFTYANWSPGQPDNGGGNEHCVHLWSRNAKYEMNDWVCNGQAYYVCEADKPKTVAISMF
ncbi:hypothetical protein DOY81_003677 [Sarcophaga bullata]|nr:hypothetical protein DOY81_003677 [Sarcophaga bullata]